ncbi:hypothetical protein [Exiguobacterium sp. s22]|uniref:hypothetical protein n=1 Tax=Exiguobacterium sp. s22 TaxID=2751272 RepID=UPI001BEA3574|nr:hypothetical protein [Exiguobacterium sp. s22]
MNKSDTESTLLLLWINQLIFVLIGFGNFIIFYSELDFYLSLKQFQIFNCLLLNLGFIGHTIFSRFSWWNKKIELSLYSNMLLFTALMTPVILLVSSIVYVSTDNDQLSILSIWNILFGGFIRQVILDTMIAHNNQV